MVGRVRRLVGGAVALVLVLSLGAAAPDLPGRGGGPDVVYTYDQQGRLASVTGPGGDGARYRYDPGGNLVAIERYGPGDDPVGVPAAESPAPVVAALSATVVHPGELLRITGEHFTGDRFLDQVVLAGRRYAPVESASPGELVVRVPPGAPSGVVSVATPAGTGQAPGELFVLPWPEVPVEDVAAAVWAEVGDAVEVSFAAAGELVLVAFEGAAGAVIGLRASGDGLSCADLRVGLSAPDGRQLRDPRWSSRWCGGAPAEVQRLPADGTYAMLVSTRGSRTGSVRLDLDLVAESPAAESVGELPAPGQVVASPEPVVDGAVVAPVDLASGTLLVEHTDLVLDDVVPLAVTRSYQPTRGTPRRRDVHAFGLGSGLEYALILETSSALQFADLVLPDGQKVPFERVTPGSAPETALFLPVTASGGLFGARIVWNGDGWDLVGEDGAVLRFGDWNTAGLESIRDRHGNQITIDRERTVLGPGHVRAVWSPSGRSVEFAHDDAGRVVEVRDHLGRTVAYRYDEAGLLTEAVALDGSQELDGWGYRYDEDRRVTAVTDADGVDLVAVAYDEDGRVARQELPGESVFSFTYTTGEQLVDGLGGAQSVVEVVTGAEVSDPAGVVRRVEFESGHWVRETYGAGSADEQTVQVERDPQTGLVTEVTEPDGRRTGLGYDRVGNLVSLTVTDGSGQDTATGYEFDPAWYGVTSVVDSGGYGSSFGYDEFGNLVAATGPDGSEVGYGYDGSGRLVSITGPDGHTTEVEYELAHRVTVTDPAGHSVSEFYDAAGRLAAVTDPEGHTARLEYDALDRIVAVVDPAGDRTSLSYDADGYLVAVSDAGGASTGYEYDERGLPVSRTDPLGAADRYTYDEAGRLVEWTDRRGVLSTVDYDNLGRPTTLAFGVDNGGPAESTVVYRYDSAGRLLAVDDSTFGTITYGYDQLDRVVSETTAAGELSHRYDQSGRRTAMVLPDGTETSYAYGEGGLLASISNPYAAVDAARDPAGRVSGLELPGGITATYGYDSRGLVTGVDYHGPQGTVGGVSYQYDASGRTVGRSGGLGGADLPAAMPPATHDAGNRLIRAGDVELVYDQAGNLVDDGTSTYTWNARGELVGIDGPVSARFDYDPFGRRVATTVDGVTVAYTYDGWDIVQQHDPAGTTTYLTGLVMDERFARTAGDGTTHTYLSDLQGSVLGLAGPEGSVTTSYGYDPYGLTTVHGEPDGNPFGYTGRERDPTGLYYYRHRYYHPQLGRFISEDPLGFAAGDTNLYAYGFNDPVNHVDPDGRQAVGTGACMAATAAGLGIALGNHEQASQLMNPDGGYVPDEDERRRIELDRLHRQNMTMLSALVAICAFAGAGPSLGGIAGAGRVGSFGRGLPTVAPRVPGIRPATAPRPAAATRPPARGCSFPADTEVLLADGSSAPIAELTVGEEVLATNPDTGQTRPEPVVDVITGHGDQTMVEITLDPRPPNLAGPAAPATVTATDNHPFWNAGGGSWTIAADLQPGDQLLSPDGTTVTITAVDTYPDTLTVHNLTVANLRTYYVLAAGIPVLVHNAPPPGCRITPSADSPMIPSKTVWTDRNRTMRVDVENPSPGTPGSAGIHLQFMGRGADPTKYYYNPSNRVWMSEQGQVLSPRIAQQVPQSAVNKANQYLGIS